MATLLFGGAEPYMQIIVEGLNQEESSLNLFRTLEQLFRVSFKIFYEFWTSGSGVDVV